MPHVIVKLWPGQPERLKQNLADKITRAVIDTFHHGEDSVSVAFEEVAAEEWMATVYEPDIRARPQTLYKKPGYEAV